ncbi:MAG: SCO family protein [Woeseiaceae bacterium]|nr:SCO family protein [Woeseiaceae bacterium]
MKFAKIDNDTHNAAARRGSTLLAAAIGVALAGVVGVFILMSRPSMPETATVLPRPVALPDFALEDQLGERFSRDRFSGRTSLVFFGFTNCPDVCPLTLQRLASMRSRLIESGEDSLPEVVFVSVDPERDTREKVAAYTAAFGDGVTGLRGSLEQIDQLAGALGAYHARPEAGDGYTVEHSSAVFVVDDRGRYHAVFSSPTDVDALVDDWPRLLQAMSETI